MNAHPALINTISTKCLDEKTDKDQMGLPSDICNFLGITCVGLRLCGKSAKSRPLRRLFSPQLPLLRIFI